VGDTPANRVTVMVEDHTGNKQRRARIAADAPVQDLLPALITALELPMTDPAGRPVTYHVAVNGQQLLDEHTLTGAGVLDGAALTIVPEMTAGGAVVAGADARLIEWGPLERCRPGPPPPRTTVHAAWAGRGLACGIEPGALATLAGHVSTHTHREVGGLLGGRVWSAGGRTHVLISAVLVASGARGGPGSLHFGLEAWLELTRLRRGLAGSRVVGWYHSHPGIGVFLSPLDCDLHQTHFSAFPWYVALVADPVRRELGAFGYDAGVLTRLGEERPARRRGAEPAA
jgi:proteasome lid subunit RPN8/RPN11